MHHRRTFVTLFYLGFELNPGEKVQSDDEIKGDVI